MAKVSPFRAVHYNTERFGKDLGRLVAPPYDVIDGVMERRLKEDRLNITHVTLGDENDKYAIAARRLRTWVQDGVLVRDPGECFYIYEQTFSTSEGQPRVRSGIVAAVKLEDFSKGVIMPHEKTIPKHKLDRLLHMCAVSGNTEQIFLLYDDPTDGIEGILAEARKREEVLRFVDPEGVHHRILRISEPELIAKISELLEPVKLLIADGHHRYETALEYRNIMRTRDRSQEGEKPYDYIMATLISFRNPGLVVFPTHRLISNVDEKLLQELPKELEEEFVLQKMAGADELAEAVDRSAVPAFGVWIPSSRTYLLATPRDKGVMDDPMASLPVYIVQEKVLKRFLGYTSEMLDTKVNIEYVKGTGPTKYAMASGEYQACFFVKPPSVEHVMAVAERGEKMPHKATYFFPKIWSGTLLNLFED